MSARRNEDAARLRRLGERECAGRSPLYERLARLAAEDDAALELVEARRPGQPPGQILLAVVHFLLLGGADHPLRRFYPDLAVEHAPPPEKLPEAFADFVRVHEPDLRRLIAGRTVGTNEPGRAAVLYPALIEATRRLGVPVLHLVETGASAGLNLLLDRYAYDYGEAAAGPAGAVLEIRCESNGSVPPPVDRIAPRILSRLGIDVEPLDPADEDDARWLRALVWPERTERAERLEAALAAARGERVPMRAGDVLGLLPGVLAGLPPGEPAVVMHAFTLGQFSGDARRRFAEILRQASTGRRIARIGYEWGEREPEAQVQVYLDGIPHPRTTVAYADAHGATIEWIRDEERRRA